MKLSTLFAPVAALALAFPASVSAEQLSLTFNRTGQYPESVKVTATGIEGVTAEMTSSSALLRPTSGAFTSAIVAPNVNGNTNPNITMEFTVTGLPAGFKYDQIGLDIHALNGQNGYQGAADTGVNRQWNVTISTGESTSSVSEFASMRDMEIAYGVNPTGTRHKVWDFAGDAVSATDPLVIRLNITKGTDNQGCFFGLSEIILTGEMEAPAPTVVSTKDIFGTLETAIGADVTTKPDTKLTLSEYSDGTYGLLLEGFGVSEYDDYGLGDVEVLNITREGSNITASNVNAPIMGGLATADMALIGTYDDTDLTFHLDVTYDGEVISADFTSVVPEPALTFRRKYTDNSSRYFNNISYTVNGETTEVYSVSDPRNESYYVAPKQNAWQEEGAYIDFTDKVIEVPADAENFTMILKSNSNVCSTKWSQNAIFVDWNNNKNYTDEGETNGVINRDKKPNEAGGGLAITSTGDTDVIALPEGLNVGDTFSVLIAMTEPKGVNGDQDLWGTQWEWTKDIFADGVCSLINGQAYELTLVIGEPLTQTPTVVSTKDLFGTLTTTIDETETTPDTKITLSEYSDGTYGLLLENYGVSEGDPYGFGDIEVTNITREGNAISANNANTLIYNGMLTADMILTGTYDDTDLVFHLDIVTMLGTYTADFTTIVEDPQPAGLTFRRYQRNANVNRYYNHISYTVGDETTVLYEVENPLNESYFVAATPNAWSEDGAYIDFTDKVIEVPVDAEDFTIILKSVDGSSFSSKWSQNAIFVDWNNNGDYTDEGETNGVINIENKANTDGGALVVKGGETDVIAVPEGLNVGDTFSVLIAMMEPLDFTNDFKDMWGANWDWTRHIFNDGVCSLVNGQAYGLTLKMTEGTSSAINAIDAENNVAPEYFNLQGMRVAADHLTPGIYVIRKGNETFKALVK